MKCVTIAEFKRNLPDLLGEVAKGASIVVQKGRRRENVAILAPFPDAPVQPRPLGLLARRGKPLFKEWTLTEEDFLAPR
jgi:antitoxin (DNA-binding transcriptional repressor) of toxin-antitoxin stability system